MKLINNLLLIIGIMSFLSVSFAMMSPTPSNKMEMTKFYHMFSAGMSMSMMKNHLSRNAVISSNEMHMNYKQFMKYRKMSNKRITKSDVMIMTFVKEGNRTADIHTLTLTMKNGMMVKFKVASFITFNKAGKIIKMSNFPIMMGVNTMDMKNMHGHGCYGKGKMFGSHAGKHSQMKHSQMIHGNMMPGQMMPNKCGMMMAY